MFFVYIKRATLKHKRTKNCNTTSFTNLKKKIGQQKDLFEYM